MTSACPTFRRKSSKSLNLSRAEKEQERALVNDNARPGPGAEEAESPHHSSLAAEGRRHVLSPIVLLRRSARSTATKSMGLIDPSTARCWAVPRAKACMGGQNPQVRKEDS
jgi:hypothetical protein